MDAASSEFSLLTAPSRTMRAFFTRVARAASLSSSVSGALEIDDIVATGEAQEKVVVFASR